MPRAALTILVALIIAIAAFAAVAPASLVDRRLAAETGGRLRLSDADGTVWRGRGAVVDAAGTWRVPVAWRIAPFSPARGVLDWTFEPLPEGGGPRGGVTLAETGVEVRNAAFSIPARALRSWTTSVALPEPGGDLHIDAPRFRYERSGGDGALDLRWERARLVWGGAVLDLGTVRAKIVPRGAELAGTIENSGGSAQVNGDFALTASSASVRATIVPSADVPPEIARGLAAIGARDANGAVRVEWRNASK